ncbi:terpenoid synthase [Aspergillus unguis]
MSLNGIKLVHSDLVDSTEVASLCGTTLPVCRSKYSHVANKALQCFHQKWEAEVGFPFYGGSSPKGAATAFFPPECKPERVEVFTNLMEYFCAHDDVLTTASKTEATLKDATNSIGWEVRKGEGSKLQTTAIKQIQSEVFLRLLEIDRPRGLHLLEAINRLSRVHETLSGDDFKCWDDLVEYRLQDFGTELYLMAIVYCCELDLSSADIEALRPVWWPATAAAALINDLYSFTKEISTELGTDTTMSNAVWYLMQTLDLTVSQARTLLLKEKIEPLERQFIAKKAEYLAAADKHPRSPDIRYFLEMVGLGLSGSWYWSTLADRFHKYNHPLPGCLPPICLEVDEETATCKSLLQSQSKKANGHDSNGEKVQDKACDSSATDAQQILQQPIDYLRSVPSKNVRGTNIQAVNVWVKAPEAVLNQVEALIGHLHDSSLLLDDIQDNSDLRRGRPTAHRVFGMPQTINAATYALTLAFQKSAGLIQAIPTNEFFEELQNLHLGQAIDLLWTRTGQCPSIEEYLEMIRLKTGALFCLAGHLLYAQAPSPDTYKQAGVKDLLVLLGQYFQVRDDYVNLTSAKYQDEKGFAQDLDEGKFSLPLIHVLTHSSKRGMIENILKQRAENRCLSKDLKTLVLSEMDKQDSLAFTKSALYRLEKDIHRQLVGIEASTGVKNFIFRFMLAWLAEV